MTALMHVQPNGLFMLTRALLFQSGNSAVHKKMQGAEVVFIIWVQEV